MGKLIIDLRQGDVLNIGDAQIHLIVKSSKASRLQIQAPKEVDITLERKIAPTNTEHITDGKHTL